MTDGGRPARALGQPHGDRRNLAGGLRRAAVPVSLRTVGKVQDNRKLKKGYS